MKFLMKIPMDGYICNQLVTTETIMTHFYWVNLSGEGAVILESTLFSSLVDGGG